MEFLFGEKAKQRVQNKMNSLMQKQRMKNFHSEKYPSDPTKL